MREVYYIRGILRNRLSYLNERILISDLDYAFHVANVDPEYIKNVAKRVTSWTPSAKKYCSRERRASYRGRELERVTKSRPSGGTFWGAKDGG
jgi:hypothetical protein